MKSIRRSMLEFMLVLLIFCALGAMGIMNLSKARKQKNERYARAILQYMHTVQEEFRAFRENDRDEDGEGEFGSLAQLLGIKETWSYNQFNFFQFNAKHDRLNPQAEARQELMDILRFQPIKREKKKEKGPDLKKPDITRVPDPANVKPESHDVESELAGGLDLEGENGFKLGGQKPIKKLPEKKPPEILYESPYFNIQTQELIFSGYVFRVILPKLRTAAKDLTEEEKTGAKTDELEKYWCAYAWPFRYGKTGEWSYFIDHRGVLYARNDPNMTGAGRTDIRAIDAYEGREFESPVDKRIWTPWSEVWARRQPKKEEKKKKTEEEQAKAKKAKEAGEAKTGTSAKGTAEETKRTEKGKTSTVKPAKLTEEEKKKTEERIGEIGDELDLGPQE